MFDSVGPQRRQPTRLPRPWDSPGKNTGVGCHFLMFLINTIGLGSGLGANLNFFLLIGKLNPLIFIDMINSLDLNSVILFLCVLCYIHLALFFMWCGFLASFKCLFWCLERSKFLFSSRHFAFLLFPVPLISLFSYLTFYCFICQFKMVYFDTSNHL